MRKFLTPPEMTEAMLETAAAKCALPASRAFVLALLAGAYIGFAAHLATMVTTGSTEWVGVQRFLTGAVFSFGLMLAVIPGSELWTGNTMMIAGVADKRITAADMLRNWMIVYTGNLIGAVLLALLVVKGTGLTDGQFGATAIKIAYAKTAEPVYGIEHQYAYFFRGLLCNWLVCLAILIAMSAQDIGGKILGIFFPIMAFVASGFEHSVANMYFIPAGIFAKSFPAAVTASGLEPASLSVLGWGSMFTGNIIAVTLGNLAGGGLMVACAMLFAYGGKNRKQHVK
ncbi:formate/nitrite transporter family protein [Geovibrio thiophilus]|uniref:Formate/nitrite transporter family protein n=1 Tax=Geovibrio thiophilus TaxID=139438 RepID=A0A410JWB4_9BACT|nr:formate/nitrite transporter family protein [Geovibrio thiophilus]QAR32510.1 formate/nitrite transporter family protein [Geovibrio thiophilus]